MYVDEDPLSLILSNLFINGMGREDEDEDSRTGNINLKSLGTMVGLESEPNERLA